MIQLVIFDCDGVLFDSWRANLAYYNAVLQQLGLPPLDRQWEARAHVLAASQLFDVMFGADSELGRAARRIARELDYGPFYELMEPVAELDVVLETLKRTYRLAMASNRGKTVAGVMQRFKLDRYFDLAVGALDVERPKPHPDMLGRCLAHFGVPPTTAVYVGDAESDLQAAQAAGVHFVAVGELTGAPDFVRHIRELPAWLDAFTR